MALIRTALGRARGLGAAHHGVGHFIVQRVSAVALVILVSWLLASAFTIAAGDYATASDFLHSPVNAALAVLLALAAFWHMQVGMRVIIEDYFARPVTKAALLVLNVFICWLAAALTILSILKVALSSAGVSV